MGTTEEKRVVQHHERKPAKMKLLKLPSATEEIPFPCVVSNAVEKNSWDSETNGTLKFLKIIISCFFFSILECLNWAVLML